MILLQNSYHGCEDFERQNEGSTESLKITARLPGVEVKDKRPINEASPIERLACQLLMPVKRQNAG